MENSVNSEQIKCPISIALEVIGGKWKCVILFQLITQGTLRFGELKKLIPDITPKILTSQLRLLETHQIICRKVYPVVPPKVEYSITDIGLTVAPIIYLMRDWGNDHRLKEL